MDAILNGFAPDGARRAGRASRRRRRRGRRPGGAGASPYGLRVLLADDNRTNQRLVELLLEKDRHEVTSVSNGREAVAKAAEQPFDLILMDVQMPGMDGFEATAAIRERERGRRRSHADRGDDRPRDGRRSREVPGRRHGPIPVQADPARRSGRDHRDADAGGSYLDATRSGPADHASRRSRAARRFRSKPEGARRRDPRVPRRRAEVPRRHPPCVERRATRRRWRRRSTR